MYLRYVQRDVPSLKIRPSRYRQLLQIGSQPQLLGTDNRELVRSLAVSFVLCSAEDRPKLVCLLLSTA